MKRFWQWLRWRIDHEELVEIAFEIGLAIFILSVFIRLAFHLVFR